MSYSGALLVSPRLWLLIHEMSTCVRAYPSEVYFGHSLVTADYVTVNFEGSFPCLHPTKSRFRPVGVGRLLVRAVAVGSSFPPEDHIFRLEEHPGYLIASGVFAEAVQARGLSGIALTALRVVDS